MLHKTWGAFRVSSLVGGDFMVQMKFENLEPFHGFRCALSLEPAWAKEIGPQGTA